MKARIRYRKYGVMRFIGHLDLMRYFQKVMRRAEIPIAFTKGFSPHMIMSFAQPLGVGVTSDAEYIDIELTQSISSAEAIRRMNLANVEGIEVTGFVQISDSKKDSGMTIVKYADYLVTLLKSKENSEISCRIPGEWETLIHEFLDQEDILIVKKTKKSEKEVNIKPMIYDMEYRTDGIYLFLATGSERNLKPSLVMDAFCRFAGLKDLTFHYHRLDVYADKLQPEDPDFPCVIVPLLDLGEEIYG